MYANTTEITMRPAVTWKLYNAAPSSQKVAHAWSRYWGLQILWALKT